MRILVFISFLVAGALSAQTGPAGVGNTNGSSALKIWLHADKGVYTDAAGTVAAGTATSSRVRIGRWNDQSGSNYHASMSNTTFMPGQIRLNSLLNNRSVIEFNRNFSGSDNFNKLTISGNPLVDSMTVLVAFYPRLAGGGSDNDASGGLSSDQYYFGAGLFCTEQPGIQNEYSVCWNNLSFGLGIGNSSIPSDVTIKLPSSLNNPHLGLASWSRLGVSRIIHDGGTAKTNNTVSTTPRSASQIMIGALNTASFDVNHFDGYIAQVIAYSKLLNQAEEIILHNYLSASYNIPLLNNDVYTMDETVNGDFDFEMAAIGMASDGSSQSTAQGESIFEISSPSALSANEYLFWAHNNASGTNTSDIPTGFNFRLNKVWMFQELGDCGTVSIRANINGLGMDSSKVYLIFDTNNNGSFLDEQKPSGAVKGTYLGNGWVDFGSVNPANVKFTLVEEHTCALTQNNSVSFAGTCSKPLLVTISESSISNAVPPLQYIVQNKVDGEISTYANPSFELGEGLYSIIVQDYYACQLTLKNDKNITFCGNSFSPNGDGVRDEYYIDKSGKIKIYDKNGKLINELIGPAYWSGNTSSGQPASGGYYLLVVGDEKIYVTLVR